MRVWARVFVSQLFGANDMVYNLRLNILIYRTNTVCNWKIVFIKFGWILMDLVLKHWISSNIQSQISHRFYEPFPTRFIQTSRWKISGSDGEWIRKQYNEPHVDVMICCLTKGDPISRFPVFLSCCKDGCQYTVIQCHSTHTKAYHIYASLHQPNVVKLHGRRMWMI